jgi:outer membrane cobalamin receptor
LRSKTLLRGVLALSISVVATSRAEEPPPVLLEEQVVQTPRPGARSDATAAATVVEASRFAGEAKDVAQLVATSPGVAVNDYGGLGQLTTVSIRGSTADGVLVLLDGLPLNSAFGGAVDLSSIPRGWIERIEVLRGPEGALHGAGALGGVVNVITRRAAAGTWSAETSAGSFGTASLSADGALPVLGGTLLLAGSADTTQGDFPYLYQPTATVPGDALVARIRENAAAARAGALARLSIPALRGRLDTVLQVSAGRRGLPGFARNPTPDDWQRDGRILLASRFARGLGGDLTVAGQVSGRLDGLDVRVGDPIPYRQRGAAGGAAGELDWAHGVGRLSARLSAEVERVEAAGLGGGLARWSTGLSIGAELLLLGARLRVAPAARLDAVGGFSGLSGKLGASWLLAEGWSLRASAGRSFRAPSLAELHFQQGLVLPNPDLAPETGLAADAALVADGRYGLFTLGGQVTRYHQLILYRPTTLGRLKPFNTGEALMAGLEAELATAPVLGPARATLSGAWTYLFSELLEGSPDEVGKQVPYRPRQRLYARATSAPGPLAFHLEAHLVGRRFTDTRNLDPIPATLAWNAGVALQVARSLGMSLHLEVKNLLDDRTLTDGLGNPLPSRLVLLTLRAGSPPAASTGTP